MEMTMKENLNQIIRYLGGTGNIVSVGSCMTRLRVKVRDEVVMEADLDVIRSAGLSPLVIVACP